jgi:hypothetical protein
MHACTTILNSSNYTIHSCPQCDLDCIVLFEHSNFCIHECHKEVTQVTTTTENFQTTTKVLTTNVLKTTTTNTLETTTSYRTPPVQTTTDVLETLTLINETPTTTFTQAPTLGAVAVPITSSPNLTFFNVSNASNYSEKYHVTVQSMHSYHADETKDMQAIVIIIIFTLCGCLLILYVCIPKHPKKRRRSVAPERQFHRIDIEDEDDDPNRTIREHIIKKWLDELIEKVDKPPPVIQAAEQLLQLRKAKHRLLRNRREKQHKQLRHLVLKNMRNNKVNSVRNPLHQPLKKQMRIKEIFNEAVKLDVQGRPKSPFKEV